jgi:hypothetical protein
MLEMEGLPLDLLHHRALFLEFARDPSCAERAELLLRYRAARPYASPVRMLRPAVLFW